MRDYLIIVSKLVLQHMEDQYIKIYVRPIVRPVRDVMKLVKDVMIFKDVTRVTH